MDINDYWKTVFDTLRDGLLVVSANGEIIAANSAAEQLTGYTAEEMLGRSCRILNCTGCQIYEDGTDHRFCSLFSQGNVRDKQCEITHKERRAVHVVKSASVLYDEQGGVLGAVETLTDVSEMVRKENEILSLRRTCHLNEGYHGLLGKSEPMQRLFELIDNVAMSDAPVMILGQSGSGKELIARAIHEASSRRNNPYIKVNCAALNENLLESELFGHVKGAFSGAHRTRIGRFEAAHEGTIFLDEIGDIPPATQAKLLRVLEENKIERVGDNRPVTVDIRLITATNKHLEALVAEGLFREDLFFRINVFPLASPSLADRKEDIPLIVNHFIGDNNLATGKQIDGTTPAAMEKLMGHSWPGNVRELRNAIEYAFILCHEKQIDVAHLPPKVVNGGAPLAVETTKPPSFSREREQMLAVLKKVRGNQSEAARMLGVSRVTVWKRIKKYGIDLSREI